MTDYLEPLLEQRSEDGEEREVPALGAEGTFPGKRRAQAAPAVPAVPAASAAPGGYAAAPAAGGADVPGGLSVPRRRVPAGERAAASAVRMEASEKEAPDRGADTFAPEGGRGQRTAAELSAALRENGGTGGAASLLRRLRAASLPEGLSARRAEVFREESVRAPEADWEEFDRRLERDARRYDGGMGIF